MTDKKLYTVELATVLTVVAESPEAAEKAAMDALRYGEIEINDYMFSAEADPMSHFPDGDEEDGVLPFGDNPEKLTIRQWIERGAAPEMERVVKLIDAESPVDRPHDITLDNPTLDDVIELARTLVLTDDNLRMDRHRIADWVSVHTTRNNCHFEMMVTADGGYAAKFEGVAIQTHLDPLDPAASAKKALREIYGLLTQAREKRIVRLSTQLDSDYMQLIHSRKKR